MIRGTVTNQFAGCPMACINGPNQSTVTVINNNTTNQFVSVIDIDANSGTYLIPDTFNHTGPCTVIVTDCNGNVLYQNDFVFPPSQNGNQRLFDDLNIQVFDPNYIDCIFPARVPPVTFCGFYTIEDTCNNTICVYNTQSSFYSSITYDFGDGAVIVADNACHTYEILGNYNITQTVFIEANVAVAGCCGGGQIIVNQAQQCQVTQGVFNIRRNNPELSITVDTDDCCPDKCPGDLRKFCINSGDTVVFNNNINVNDLDCTSIINDPANPLGLPDLGGDLTNVPVLVFDTVPLPNNCNTSLFFDNLDVLGNPGPNVVLYNAPEYVTVSRDPSYNIGTADYTFEFWFNPMNGYFPITAPGWVNTPQDRVIFSWQNNTAPGAVAANSNRVKVGVYLTPNNTILFQITEISPNFSIGSVESFPVLNPLQYNHIVVVKGGNPLGNNANNWNIFINGVLQTNPALTINTLAVNGDNFDRTGGDLHFAAEWDALAADTTTVNVLTNPNVIPLNGIGISQNYGEYKIKNFRFYQRALLAPEVVQNFNLACYSDPSDASNLLIYTPFDDLPGSAVATELVLGNDGVLFNFNPARLDAQGQDEAWTNVFNDCCGLYTVTINRPDGLMDVLGVGARFAYWFQQEGEYILQSQYCNCCGCCETEYKIYVGPTIYATRTDCLKFRLSDRNSYNQPYNLNITIYNAENQVVLNNQYVDYLGDDDFEIELPFDGVYVVEYVLTNPATNDVLAKERIMLFDFCTIIQCYKKLLMDINCTDCNKCIEDIRGHNVQMYKINTFLMNFQAFVMNMTVQFGNTNGMLYFEEKYLTFIEDSQFYIDRLLALCSKCGYTDKMLNVPIRCTPKKAKSCC